MRRTQKRGMVALLTPYSGCNLGDGAIQDAVIHALRTLQPGTSINLISADTEYTEKLHGVPSFPLTGLHIAAYSLTLDERRKSANRRGDGVRARVKNALRRSPFAYRCVKLAWAPLRLIVATPRTIARELGHLVRAFRFARRCDLIVVSGGGQLDEYWGGAMGHPYTLFKWALLTRLANTELIFMSVGVSQVNHWLSRLFIAQALNLATYRSYRDANSKERLKSWKFTHRDAVYPDLAFSYVRQVPPPPERHKTDEPRTVGISPIAYLSSYGWPKTDPGFFESYLRILQLFADQLLSDGYNIVLFATDSPDRPVVDELFARITAYSKPPSERLRRAQVTSVAELFACLDTLDLVVASRLHGIILSHISGKVTLAVSYDRKVDTYMRAVEQREHCIDIHRLTTPSLVHAFRRLREDRARSELKVGRHNRSSRDALGHQYQRLFGERGPRALDDTTASTTASAAEEFHAG